MVHCEPHISHNTMYESKDTMYNGDVCRNTAESNRSWSTSLQDLICRSTSQTRNVSVLAGTGAIKWVLDAGGTLLYPISLLIGG